jgi:two-component system, NtrC family, response regulator AtoC
MTTFPAVLVVEDEAVVAMELEERLVSLGYKVAASVPSGEEAVRKAEELKPDLVLMDIRLQGEIDGIEAATRIKDTDYIPVVYLTAHTDDKTLQRAKATEPFGYLVKPFSERDLAVTLDMALYKAKMEKQLRDGEERFRAVIESAEDLIYIKDAELRYTHVNPAMLVLLAMDKSSVIGRTDEELLGRTEARRSKDQDDRVINGATVEFELNTLMKGYPVVVSFIKAPLKDSRGRVVGVAGIGRDITDRKRREIAADSEIIETSANDYRSAAMRHAVKQVLKAAATDSVCLFLGESGVGKDFFARFLHDHSPRGRGPFFSINCAALSPELVESELFGHEAGAFTGAIKRKRGLLELAESGTLLLNEIGELTLRLQSKLLAFLDTGEFTRVGGERNISINARIIAATNRDLEMELDAGSFRHDLFYRLNVLVMRVPPLRERREDIPLLANTLLEKLTRQVGLHRPPLIDPEAMTLLEGYDWPGNVRELRNILERALILGDGDRITPEHIELIHKRSNSGKGLSITLEFGEGVTFNDALREAKKAAAVEALTRSGGGVTEAARLMGISRDAMNYLIKSLDLKTK